MNNYLSFIHSIFLHFNSVFYYVIYGFINRVLDGLRQSGSEKLNVLVSLRELSRVFNYVAETPNYCFSIRNIILIDIIQPHVSLWRSALLFLLGLRMKVLYKVFSLIWKLNLLLLIILND